MDMKKSVCLYLCTVFTVRLMLRSSLAEAFHWAVLMLLEDGMSLLSFAMGLYYLHCSDGAPLAVVSKCIAVRAEGNVLAPYVAQDASSSQADRRIRLFSLAL